MAEQLAFRQRFDECRAVEGDELAILARPELVQRARHQLLAGAGLAGDERGARVRRQPPHEIEQLLHHRAAAHHPVELETVGDVGVGRQQALPAGDAVAHAAEQLAQPVEVERLAQVVERAELHRFDRRFHRGLGRHQDHLAIRDRSRGSPSAARGRRLPACSDRAGRRRGSAPAARSGARTRPGA